MINFYTVEVFNGEDLSDLYIVYFWIIKLLYHAYLYPCQWRQKAFLAFNFPGRDFFADLDAGSVKNIRNLLHESVKVFII